MVISVLNIKNKGVLGETLSLKIESSTEVKVDYV